MWIAVDSVTATDSTLSLVNAATAAAAATVLVAAMIIVSAPSSRRPTVAMAVVPAAGLDLLYLFVEAPGDSVIAALASGLAIAGWSLGHRRHRAALLAALVGGSAVGMVGYLQYSFTGPADPGPAVAGAGALSPGAAVFWFTFGLYAVVLALAVAAVWFGVWIDRRIGDKSDVHSGRDSDETRVFILGATAMSLGGIAVGAVVLFWLVGSALPTAMVVMVAGAGVAACGAIMLAADPAVRPRGWTAVTLVVAALVVVLADSSPVGVSGLALGGGLAAWFVGRRRLPVLALAPVAGCVLLVEAQVFYWLIGQQWQSHWYFVSIAVVLGLPLTWLGTIGGFAHLGARVDPQTTDAAIGDAAG
ncbi:hypothetical protein nbrc107697_34000 [Gordonia crocea]|uniref:Uncharacterized protein n=1 Tax=Gordonia crocea TaxID=589162 RepID=A0A7I9V1U9_9ACTN|nr:hypothetical protein nbrc107697_30280 [Gordonia crocea]GED99361.1 hypothetical protein nbrc107697_34000 [Gordonia crocea]